MIGIPGPDALGLAPGAPYPLGARVELAGSLQRFRPDVLFGGAPPRLLRLSPSGRRALEELASGPVQSPSGAVLARRLTDAGMAHPAPLPVADPAVTVVVPVRDRSEDLGECLGALARGSAGIEVVVVDDGSTDRVAVEQVCARAGVQLVRRPVSGGPAAARNTGLVRARAPFVAFVDSDCRVPSGWLDRLVGHFADPLVAAVAPRVLGDGGLLASPLDLGEEPANVAPGTSVGYVPTAALVARRDILGPGFDESLRYGEDVDLCWRLLEAGWRVRYDPAVVVGHREPTGVPAQLRRRFAYGTSAGPLDRRHPGRVVHLVLSPAPTATVLACVAGRPLTALAAWGGSVALLQHRLRTFDVRPGELARPVAQAAAQTWTALGRFAVQFAWPLVVLGLLHPGSRRPATRRARRLSLLALVLTAAAASLRGQPRTGPGRRAAGGLLALGELAAYGLGVVTGCLRAGTAGPLRPRWIGWGPFSGTGDEAWNPGRVDDPAPP